MTDNITIHKHIEGAHYLLEENPPCALAHLIAGNVGMDDIADRMQREIDSARGNDEHMQEFFEKWQPFVKECILMCDENLPERSFSRKQHIDAIDHNPTLSKLINESLVRMAKSKEAPEIKTKKHVLILDLFNTLTDANLYIPKGDALIQDLSKALTKSRDAIAIDPLDNITENAEEKLSGNIVPQNILTLMEFKQLTIDDIIHEMRDEYSSSHDVEAFVDRWHPLIEEFALLTQKHLEFTPDDTKNLIDLNVPLTPLINPILRKNSHIAVPTAKGTSTPSRASVGLEIVMMRCLAEPEAPQNELKNTKLYIEKALRSHFKEKHSDIDPTSTTILNAPHNQKTLH